MKAIQWFGILFLLLIGFFMFTKRQTVPRGADSSSPARIVYDPKKESDFSSDRHESFPTPDTSGVELLINTDAANYPIAPSDPNHRPTDSESIAPPPSDVRSRLESGPTSAPINTSASQVKEALPIMPLPTALSKNGPDEARAPLLEGSSASSKANAPIPSIPDPNKRK